MTVSALAATVAMAFNLSCSVHGYTGPKGKPPTPTSYNTIIRVDLATMRWCDAECTETKPIASVSSTEIVLSPSGSGSFSDFRKVNRESGAYVHDGGYSGVWGVAEDGTCEPEEFTGFPARKF